ncbi:unnamed protein product [Urochloa humidicola]
MELGSKQDGVVNMTRAMEALSPWLNNPRRTIVQVEALVVTAAALLLLQLIFGCCKRRWHNSFVKGALLFCNSLMFPLIIYTLSMMQSSPIKNSSYPVWAIFLIMASNGTVAVQQYDFYGSALKKYGQAAVEICRYSFYVTMVMLLMSPGAEKERLNYLNTKIRFASVSSSWVRLLIVVVIWTKFVEDLLLLVREAIDLRNCRSFAHGMRTGKWKNYHLTDYRLSDSDPESMDLSNSDTESMKGYNYLVQFPSVTIDKIWDRCGNSDDGKALKDICLSFALFQLLKRRYLGLACAEASVPETRQFVLRKLLSSEGEYERAFRVVEVELGFCYDYFFTKYAFVYALVDEVPHPFFQLYVIVFFLILLGLKIISISAVGVFAFRKSLVLETQNPIVEVHSTMADYRITLLVLAIALIVQLLEAAFYLASDWVQVSLACKYTKKNCYVSLVCLVPQILQELFVLGNMLERRNMLPSAKTFCKLCKFKQVLDAFIGKVIGFLRRVTISGALTSKIYQHSLLSGKERPVQVSDTVKRAIARSLISSLRKNQNSNVTNGVLTNGETSLSENQNLVWTLKNHSQLEIMFIWHIATEYCALSEDHRNGITRDDRGVAVNLSRYIAYLIAYVPQLLPYDEVDIKESLRKVVEDEIDGGHFSFFFETKNSKYHWSYDKMKSVNETEGEDNPTTVLGKGVKLGKQLESMPDGAYRWKVMEEFWAETLLYVAPSHSTAKQHMKHLENGGEFLTLIWALLSHAGILNLNRDKDRGQEAAETA